MKTVDIYDFVNDMEEGQDFTPIVFSALQECKKIEQPVLFFPKGTYHFWPDRAFEKYCFISNNDQGLKRFAFPLWEIKNFTLDGNGSEFIFHGRIIPFGLENTENITIKNVYIDYDRPFFSQGEIIGADLSFIDLKIPKSQFPYRLEGDRIVFYGEGWECKDMVVLLPFDPSTKAPSYKMRDTYLKNTPIRVEEEGEDIVRFKGKFKQVHNPGDILTIKHEHRLNPGFMITDSRNVLLESIHIYHTATMGLIAQLTENVTLRNFNTVLRPGSDRIVSCSADSTHFVNCSGDIIIEDCVFENQLDDALNVHGMYTEVRRRLSENEFETEIMHHQQNGVVVYKPGDRIRFVDQTSLLPVCEASVKQVNWVHQKIARITIDRPLPEAMQTNTVIENISTAPNLMLRNCKIGSNRARGILVTTAGKVVIENNLFYSGGAAIKISGDANNWYESGAVRDLTIRKNRFADCGYGPWGKAVIDIDPEIERPEASDAYYHSNIVIEENHFEVFDRGVLWAHSVDGLIFQSNEVKTTESFVPYKPMSFSIELNACNNVEIMNNRAKGVDQSDFLSANQVSNLTMEGNEWIKK